MSLQGEVIVLSILPLRWQMQNWILRDRGKGVCSEEKEPREKVENMTNRCSFCLHYRVLVQAGSAPARSPASLCLDFPMYKVAMVIFRTLPDTE